MKAERVNIFVDKSKAIGLLMQVEADLDAGPISAELGELVRIRASQINGCAFCLDAHWKKAVKLGISEQRLSLLPVWRDSHLFDAREKAALAWTEAVTRIETVGTDDALYEELKSHFDAAEIADLTLMIANINSFNRMGKAMEVIHG